MVIYLFLFIYFGGPRLSSVKKNPLIIPESLLSEGKFHSDNHLINCLCCYYTISQPHNDVNIIRDPNHRKKKNKDYTQI